MADKGLRKTFAERQAEKEKKQKQKRTTDKILIGAAAVTTASAMVAAIYAACRALDKEKTASLSEDAECAEATAAEEL